MYTMCVCARVCVCYKYNSEGIETHNAICKREGNKKVEADMAAWM